MHVLLATIDSENGMNAAREHQHEQSGEVLHIETQTTTALALVTQSITEINAFETGIAELEHQYKGVVFEVDTTAGMDDACKARLAIRKPRYAIQNLQKQAKATLNGLKDGIDEQAEGYIARIAAVEDPVHEQIANEEARKKAEKEARRAAEQARTEAIQERVTDIRDSAALAAGKSASDIELMITELVALAVDDSFAEFKSRAEVAKESTLVRLRIIHTAAVASETEAKRLEEVRVQLAQEKAEQDAAAAKERERIAEEQRVAREAATFEAARVAQENRKAEEARRLRERQQDAVRAIQDRVHTAAEADTLEGYDLAISVTQGEAITEERFGAVIETARTVQINTLLTLRQRQIALAKRLADEAELEEQRWQQQAEAARLADVQADLDRQQEAIRLSQETIASPSDPVEATATEDVQPSNLATIVATEKPARPSDAAIVEILTRAFSVDRDTILDWLWDMDLTALAHGAPVEQSEPVTA